MASIKIKNLSRSFEPSLSVFNDYNLDIPSGSRMAIQGPNGSGKTTLLKLIAGLLLPQQGQVFVQDFCTRDDSKKVQQLVGWVPSDEMSFFPRLNGRENIQAFLGHQLSTGDIENRIEQLPKSEVLDQVLQRPYYLCSRGMKQILNLLRAILGGPEVLLMDEPSIGLDQEHRDYFLSLLEHLFADKTVLLTSHDLSFLDSFGGERISLEGSIPC